MGEDQTNNLTQDAIHVQKLSHRYPEPKRKRPSANSPKTNTRAFALDGVSLSVHRGELFGILGPNGGGKTTLFRILSTMLRPSLASGSNQSPESDRTAGSVHVMGYDSVNEPAQVRQRLGVIFQSPSLDTQLTANENLQYHGRLYGLNSNVRAERIERWLTFFDLQDRRDEYVERFSGGMRRRLELAKALLHEPALLLMDEPATGLDPGARRILWQLLDQIREESGMTIVFTTHLMDEAERCDRLAIMAEGKIATVDTPENLRSRIGGDVITFEPDPLPDGDAVQRLAQQIADRFGPWEQDAAPITVDGRVRFEKPDGARVVADVAAAFPDQIRSLTVGRPTLEDVFLHLTGASLSEDAK